MSEVTIRKMTKADVGAASVLAGALVRQHHEFDRRRFLLDGDPVAGYRWYLNKLLDGDTGELGIDPSQALLLVAEVTENGRAEVAGYLYGALEPRDWSLLLEAHAAVHDIYVDERFRRRGIAQKLMLDAIARFRELGRTQVVLSSATQNAASQALFEALGFRRTMVEMTYDPAP